MGIAAPAEKEKPLMLGQVSSSEGQKVEEKTERHRLPPRDSDVPTPKHVNTKGTLLLYFCIMSVLVIFCLGRCLVVPLSQASRFELNQRKHVRRLDKNQFIQNEVIS